MKTLLKSAIEDSHANPSPAGTPAIPSNLGIPEGLAAPPSGSGRPHATTGEGALSRIEEGRTVEAPMAKRVRIHKYIANAGYCSRRHAELLIEAGLVEVNGEAVREAGRQIDPRLDAVTIHGEVILPPERLTIALNKPTGFISSTHDTHDRLTVMDLLPRSVRRLGVVPVGRLDLDTRGLLLMTNDGDLHHLVTHPRYGCPKEYIVRIGGRLEREDRERLARGIELEDGETQPVQILSSHQSGGETELRLELREGRKREIKRIFAALGHEVLYLERVRVGPLRLGDLAPRAWRRLSPEEIDALRAACRTGRRGSR